MQATFLLFITTSLILNITPGPDVLYVIANSTQEKKRGYIAAIGLGIGYLFHVIIAVIGLSTLIMQSAILFSILKYIGVGYLCYLGIKSLLQKNKSIEIQEKKEISLGKILQQGILVSILNPKVALFFLAFLPQFVHIEAGDTTQQFCILGISFTITATLCNLGYAFLSGYIFSRIHKNSKLLERQEKITGIVLLGLAAKLLYTQQK